MIWAVRNPDFAKAIKEGGIYRVKPFFEQRVGAEQVEQRLVSQSPEDQEVRYFHSTDRSAAILVHDALALVFTGIEVRDFTHFTPSPHQKLIEVWL